MYVWHFSITISIDVYKRQKVNGEYSINTVSFGFDVEVARQVNALKKNIKTEGIIPVSYTHLS